MPRGEPGVSASRRHWPCQPRGAGDAELGGERGRALAFPAGYKLKGGT